MLMEILDCGKAASSVESVVDNQRRGEKTVFKFPVQEKP